MPGDRVAESGKFGAGTSENRGGCGNGDLRNPTRLRFKTVRNDRDATTSSTTTGSLPDTHYTRLWLSGCAKTVPLTVLEALESG